MTIFVGDDWAETHHDVHLMNDNGERLAVKRLPEGLEGIRRFHQLIAEQQVQPADVVIGIETERGLWVQALLAAGYRVYAINPLSVSRYRDRHSLAGAKSDPGDAKLLADLVRTDRHNHRAIAGDSDQAQAIKVLARAHQALIWTRTEHTNRLRSALREYYPAALETFNDLDDRDAVAVLTKAPTPETAKRLRVTQIRGLLQKGDGNAISTHAPEKSTKRSNAINSPHRQQCPPRSEPPHCQRCESSPSSTFKSSSSKPL
jgi:transposase